MSRTNAYWLIAYLVVAAAIVGSMFAARDAALRDFTTPEVQASWDRFRDEARGQSGGPARDPAQVKGPVMRSVPKSAEPPALVLMRDYFAGCLVTALVFGSVLFGVMMFLIRGVWAGRRSPA